MNVVLFMYGIGRSRHTISHIYSFVKSYCAHYQLNLHTIYAYQPVAQVSNPRSNEHNQLVPISNELIDRFDFVIKFSQQELIQTYISTLGPFLSLLPDIHSDNHKTTSNLFCQLSMLKQASQAFENYSSKDSIILSVRDDLYFQDLKSLSFALNRAQSLHSKRYIITSSFHWHAGINDRFFISDTLTARHIFQRLDIMLNFYRKLLPISAERIMLYSLPRSVLLLSAPIKHLRVRSNNRFRREHYFYSLHRPLELIRVFYSRLHYYFIALLYR